MREIIVVDIETGGLGTGASILEVAAVNLATGREMRFVPYVTMAEVGASQPKALQVNRYFERGVFENMLTEGETAAWYRDLSKMLQGNTFAGSNPTFDSTVLRRPMNGAIWHHRLLDLSAYAAGVQGWPINDLQGLASICELLKVENTEPHSALGDARATAECFKKLQAAQRVIG